MKPGNFFCIIKWITGIVFLFSISCKDREWEFQATVSTNEITVFSDVAAVVGGTLINEGHSVVSETGVCYSQVPNPDLDENRVNLSGGLSEFSGKIESLEQGTTYYVRAYAINSKGVSYGEEVSFRTDPPLTDADGNEYKTVIIGEQIWMAENLKTTKYNDGTSIPLITDGTTWSTYNDGAYCYFANDTNNQIIYGNLYNWYAVVDNRKLCPSGWHVPTMNDVNNLRTYLGGESIAGGKLKEVGTTHWMSPNTGATNESGFTALPSGNRNYFGNFDGTLQGSTAFWTTHDLNTFGGVFVLVSGNAEMITRGWGKLSGLPVRCIKD
jgi:uncharacterized protein (TIGR02145 family)